MSLRLECTGCSDGLPIIYEVRGLPASDGCRIYFVNQQWVIAWYRNSSQLPFADNRHDSPESALDAIAKSDMLKTA